MSSAASSACPRAAQSTLQGLYGSLLLASDGAYTYTLDNTRAATQSLTAGQLVAGTFTYTITDGPGSIDAERSTRR